MRICLKVFSIFVVMHAASASSDAGSAKTLNTLMAHGDLVVGDEMAIVVSPADALKMAEQIEKLKSANSQLQKSGAEQTEVIAKQTEEIRKLYEQLQAPVALIKQKDAEIQRLSHILDEKTVTEGQLRGRIEELTLRIQVCQLQLDQLCLQHQSSLQDLESSQVSAPPRGYPVPVPLGEGVPTFMKNVYAKSLSPANPLVLPDTVPQPEYFPVTPSAHMVNAPVPPRKYNMRCSSSEVFSPPQSRTSRVFKPSPTLPDSHKPVSHVHTFPSSPNISDKQISTSDRKSQPEKLPPPPKNPATKTPSNLSPSAKTFVPSHVPIEPFIASEDE